MFTIFLRVSSQCDILPRIPPGWYGYIQYPVFTWLYTRWDRCVCLCVYIYLYICLFVYIYIYICVCILCIVYLGLNTEVILDLMFQLIEICFAVRMTVDPTSCISNWSCHVFSRIISMNMGFVKIWQILTVTQVMGSIIIYL